MITDLASQKITAISCCIDFAAAFRADAREATFGADCVKDTGADEPYLFYGREGFLEPLPPVVEGVLQKPGALAPRESDERI